MLIRWQAVIYYRTANGTVDVTHDLSEIADLHDLVEHGPHWDTVVKIEVVRINHSDSETLTVEQSETLTVAQSIALKERRAGKGEAEVNFAASSAIFMGIDAASEFSAQISHDVCSRGHDAWAPPPSRIASRSPLARLKSKFPLQVDGFKRWV
jgi:hypothetical protein